MTVHELLTGNSTENCAIKCEQIAATVQAGTYQSDGTKIEMGAVTNLDGKAVVVLARAWDEGGNPIGFGPDGSVEWERFRFFNPPIMVPDGTKRREPAPVPHTFPNDEMEIHNFKEDLTGALRQIIAQTIKTVGKPGAAVTPGKTGATTSTFYPDADPESTSVDGYMVSISPLSGGSWALARSQGAGTYTEVYHSNNAVHVGVFYGPEGWAIRRIALLFDTSSIPDTDTVTAATMTLYVWLWGVGIGGAGEGYNWIAVTTCNPASNTTLASTDFPSWTNIEQSDRKTPDLSMYDTFQTWTLTSTGRASVSKTGVSKFAMQSGFDINNTSIAQWQNWSSLGFYSAEAAAGTTHDPRLTVEHSFIPSSSGFFFRFLSIAAPTVGLAAASSYLSWLTNASA